MVRPALPRELLTEHAGRGTEPIRGFGIVRSSKREKFQGDFASPLQYPSVHYRNRRERALQRHRNRIGIATQVNARRRDATILENFRNPLIRCSLVSPVRALFRNCFESLSRAPRQHEIPPLHAHALRSTPQREVRGETRRAAGAGACWCAAVVRGGRGGRGRQAGEAYARPPSPEIPGYIVLGFFSPILQR